MELWRAMYWRMRETARAMQDLEMLEDLQSPLKEKRVIESVVALALLHALLLLLQDLFILLCLVRRQKSRDPLV